MSITGSEQWMYSSGREFYDFPIEQSLRFNDDDSAYLSRTPATASNRKTWTFSAWIKLGSLSQGERGTIFQSNYGGPTIYQDSGLRFAHAWDPAGTDYIRETVGLFRDTSAWYHVVWWCDTTQAGTRWKIYVNGTEQTLQTPAGNNGEPAQNTDLNINSTNAHTIGNFAGTYFDGYLADVNFIDGQALDPTSFGETKSGIWIPKDTSGLTFGTNGFRLQFGDTTEANGFNTVLWEGNGTATTTTNVVQGFGFSPDFVWFKRRDDARDHFLYDTVRGASTYLHSNATNADATDATYGLQSFDTDGFTVTGNSAWSNNNGSPYVAWAWDAGSGSAASNTDGSITSTVKANTDYGFSITSYTGNGSAGATVGHSLGVAPDMYIVKNRSAVQNWRVYHSSQGSSKGTSLNTTDAFVSVGYWNNTDPTSTVFSVDDSAKVNASGNNYIAYCFAEKTGYSKFGTYSGTGAAGNSITTGFKPAFVMFKRTDSTSDWFMLDNTRDTSNPIDKKLEANTSGAEVVNAAYETDFNSDGFVLQNTNAQLNASGGSYIFMAFSDTRNAAFWRDTSGQGNDWQPNNLVFSDVVPDSTTNNFNTFSSVIPSNSGSLSEGNLKSSSVSGGASNYGPMSSYNVHSGKWYFEFKITGGTANDIYAGAFYARTDNSIRFGKDMTAVYNGKIYADGVAVQTGLANPATNDVFSFAVDVDNSTCQVYRNGSAYGTLVDFSSSSYISNGFMGMGHYHGSSSTNSTAVVNYGQDSTFAGNEAAGGNADENGYGDFKYAVPSGFLSLCSANLPTGAIDTLADETPEDYFNTVLYSGNNNNSQTISGVGFEPSMLWIKCRDSVEHHHISDAVRGANKFLFSNETNAERTGSHDGGENTVAYTSDGFSFTSTGVADEINFGSRSYVAWNWKAGGTGVSNTDGSITSTVSVGATSQQNWFSVVSWVSTTSTSDTVGHGLGQKPSLIITKNRNITQDWWTYTTAVDGTYDGLRLNLTDASFDASSVAAPTSSVFSNVNTGGAYDNIAYCFANAEGLCKVGSYTGNGSSTDGTFVFTGHRPAWIMVKRLTSGAGWSIFDNTRNSFNPSNAILQANTSNSEGTSYPVDFLSNGFKMRNSDSTHNQSGTSYIYLAIAEQPFKYANAR